MEEKEREGVIRFLRTKERDWKCIVKERVLRLWKAYYICPCIGA